MPFLDPHFYMNTPARRILRCQTRVRAKTHVNMHGFGPNRPQTRVRAKTHVNMHGFGPNRPPPFLYEHPGTSCFTMSNACPCKNTRKYAWIRPVFLRYVRAGRKIRCPTHVQNLTFKNTREYAWIRILFNHRISHGPPRSQAPIHGL